MVAETTTGLLIGFKEAKVCKILVAVSAAVSAAIETNELDVFMTLLTFFGALMAPSLVRRVSQK